MKNEKEILKLLSYTNRKKFASLEEDIKKRIVESLDYAYRSIVFVDKKDYYEAVKQDYKDYLYFYEHRWEQYKEFRNSGAIDAIHGLDNFFSSEYYRKHSKFEDYPVLEKDFPDKWKMFVYPGNTHVRGKLPVLKAKEKKIVNVIFEHILKYKQTMGAFSVTSFVSQFCYLSHEEIIAGYEEILEKYRPKD